MTGPDPEILAPVAPACDGTVFLRARTRADVAVVACVDHDERAGARKVFGGNLRHGDVFFGDHLTVGPFCAIAHVVRIFLNGSTHAMNGFSTLPFDIFGHGWQDGFDPETRTAAQMGDTPTGPDVWIGDGAPITPGVTVSAGAIVAAMSAVTHDAPPDAVVAGSPARVVRCRFDEPKAARLLAGICRNRPTGRLARSLNSLRGADLTARERAA